MALVSKAVHVEWTREQNNKKEEKIKYDLIYLLVSIYLFVCVFLLYIFVGTCWSEGKLREKKPTQVKWKCTSNTERETDTERATKWDNVRAVVVDVT